MAKLIANGVCFLNGQNVIKPVAEVSNTGRDQLNCLLVKVENTVGENLVKKEDAMPSNVHVSTSSLNG